MSASHEWTEWHLTPRGWESGSEQTDFQETKEVDPPEGRVVRCVYDEYLGPRFGKCHKTTKVIWRGDDEELIMLEKYGECPQRL